MTNETKMNENNMSDMSDMTATTDPELASCYNDGWASLFRDAATIVKAAPYFANEKLQAAKEHLCQGAWRSLTRQPVLRRHLPLYGRSGL